MADHFVLTLDIKQVTPAVPAKPSRGAYGESQANKEGTERQVEDHTRVVIRADTLDQLVARLDGQVSLLKNDLEVDL